MMRVKFKHIMNCEEWLGLRRDDLIGDVTSPDEISWLDMFRVTKSNSVLFIMRMQLALIAFAILFAGASMLVQTR